MFVSVELSTMSGCIVVMSSEDVCCSVVFGTLVGLFSIIWSELMMTSAISCPLWSLVYECQRVECGLFEMCCMQCFMSVSTVL